MSIEELSISESVSEKISKNRMQIFLLLFPLPPHTLSTLIHSSLSPALLFSLSPLPPFRSLHILSPSNYSVVVLVNVDRHFRRDSQGQGFGKHVKEGNSHNIKAKREERERSGRRGRDNESSSDVYSQTIPSLFSRPSSLSPPLSLSTLFPPHLGSPAHQIAEGDVEFAHHIVIGISHPRPIDSLEKEERGNG